MRIGRSCLRSHRQAATRSAYCCDSHGKPQAWSRPCFPMFGNFGEGVSAHCGDVPVCLGRPRSVVSFFGLTSEHRHGDRSALISFADALRPDTIGTLAELGGMGLKTLIASRDQPDAPEEIARAICTTAIGHLRPADKLALIRTAERQGRKDTKRAGPNPPFLIPAAAISAGEWDGSDLEPAPSAIPCSAVTPPVLHARSLPQVSGIAHAVCADQFPFRTEFVSFCCRCDKPMFIRLIPATAKLIARVAENTATNSLTSPKITIANIARGAPAIKANPSPRSANPRTSSHAQFAVGPKRD